MTEPQVPGATSGPTRFVVHIGLPKTASTLLQQRVFSSHPSVAFLEGRAGNADADHLTKYIQSNDSVSYEVSTARRLLDAAITKAPAQRRTYVISRESFTANGGIDPSLIAQRLRALLGRSAILLLIRNPYEMVESMFLQDLKGVGTGPGTGKRRIADFNEWFEWHWVNRETRRSRLQRLLYHRVAGAYAENFGVDNVHIVPFELLKDDRSAFADRLAACLGVESGPICDAVEGKPVNPRMTRIDQMRAQLIAHSPAFAGFVSRYTPELLRRAVRSSALGDPARVVISSSIRTRIAEWAAPECTALARDWNLDLGQYGYPMAEDG